MTICKKNEIMNHWKYHNKEYIISTYTMEEQEEKFLISLDPPAGTRDFMPEDMRVRNWLFAFWKNVSRRFGYGEYDAPVVEYEELYTRKGGDDITKEMFAFTLGNNKLALRPEMTPSIARMMMKYYKTSPPPFKMFSIPQCWRYEDIKRGRKREHFQWNCDIFGAEKVLSEIEIFQMVTTFFEAVGLTSSDVILKVSNRMILQKVLDGMGVPKDSFARACVLIDKLAKIPKEEMTELLRTEISLTEEQVDTIYELCSVTNIDCLSKFLGENDETFLEMKKIFDIADKIGIGKWLQLDVSIVRGLSYYTGIVFEGFSLTLPNLQKSICGGGRYDNLLSSYGYKEQVPAIGFGFGDVVIVEMLRDLGKLPLCPTETQYLVVPFNESFFVEASQVAQLMRGKGINAELYTKNTRITKAYDYADRKGINSVVLIAPGEWAEKKIVLKKLRETDTKLKQVTIELGEFIDGL